MATEKRPIDANALMDYIDKEHPYAGLPMAALVCTKELLTYSPTVDAVEVVRCKDCKYFSPKVDGTVGFCVCGEVCGYCHSMRIADDFCSYGERKTK